MRRWWRGAQSSADRHFAFAHGGAHEQNICNVHASKKQHHSRESEEQTADGEHGIIRIGVRSRAQLRVRQHGHILVGVGVILGQTLRNDCQRGLRLRERGARPEPGQVLHFCEAHGWS